MSEQLGEQKMSEIIVYHGGTEKVEFPICKFGRRNLDFGQGFYVTDLRQQAVDWATQVADRRKLPPINNYDYIEGGVANDRVIDTVNLYMAGLLDLDTALAPFLWSWPSD